MISYFVIVRYVPDPIADERINVGAIVFGDKFLRARFVPRWSRIQQFGGEDVTFLKEFARRAAEATSPQQGFLPDAPERWDEALMERLGRWRNSIQLSERKASLKDPDELLAEVYRRYVKPRVSQARGIRTRSSMAAAAVRKVSAAIAARLGPAGAQNLVKKNHPVSGALADHKFDLVLENGRPFLAAQALSFEIATMANLERDVDATAWTIDDVKKRDQDIALAVTIAPPPHPTKAYISAERIFRGLGATVVEPDGLDEWALQVASGFRK